MPLLTDIAGNVYVALAVVVFFGVTIFVHEFGHFVVARLCGMTVKVFSIGFGPAVWQRKRGGIVYKVGAIPFGGYVALPQLDPSGMSAIQGSSGGEGAETLPRISPWKRILVSLAGASGNVMLAVAIVWIVFWVGIPAGPSERSAQVGFVEPDSKALALGIRPGDVIETVNGRAVASWSQVRAEAALSREARLVVRKPDGVKVPVTLATEKGLLGEQALPGLAGRDLANVLQVDPGMSAAQAGVKAGDTIIAFDGREVFSRAHLAVMVAECAGRTVSLQVLRPGEDGQAVRLLEVTPRLDESLGRPRIGVRFNPAAVDLDTIVHPRPGEQLRSHAGLIFRFLKALITPQRARAASGAVGGPVAIVISYWAIMRTSLMLAVWFTGLLNVNLAIINLLPLPVLDGGHIVFALWEGITRRPVHARVVNTLVNVFSVLIIAVFVLISIRDLDRFTPLGRLVRGLFHGDGETVAPDLSPEGSGSEP